eukprot:755659-Hanusia_phi.AAC.2
METGMKTGEQESRERRERRRKSSRNSQNFLEIEASNITLPLISKQRLLEVVAQCRMYNTVQVQNFLHIPHNSLLLPPPLVYLRYICTPSPSSSSPSASSSSPSSSSSTSSSSSSPSSSSSTSSSPSSPSSPSPTLPTSTPASHCLPNPPPAPVPIKISIFSASKRTSSTSPGLRS